jgi:peptide/nickel transport system permease protein
MIRYAQRRLLLLVPTLLGTLTALFIALRLVPGDVIVARIGQSGRVTPEQLAQLRASMGLDRPLYEQYLGWLGGLARGDLGQSLWTGRPVVQEILTALPVTAELALLGATLALLVAVPVGVASATRQNSWVDYAARLFSIAGLSAPNFWIATIVIVFLSVNFRWLPSTVYVSPLKDPAANLIQFVIPSAIVGLALSASAMRMTRSALLEVLRDDYILTARAKGVREAHVVRLHALRNALIPVVTVVGAQWGYLLGGSVVIEFIFGLPGMGTLILNAIQTRDYTLMQGSVLAVGLWMLLINLAVDLSYFALDPRLRDAHG